MSPLETFLATEPSDKENPVKGSLGEESDWLAFGEINCASGKFLVIDPAFAPEIESGLLVDCAPGVYQLDAKVMTFGNDKRISRLRAVKRGTPSHTVGSKIGEAWSDVARIGVCDVDALSRAWNEDEDAANDAAESWMDDDGPVVTLTLPGHPEAPICAVDSGFGDGTFPVLELLTGGLRVGLEVELIEAGTLYPFDPIPDTPPAMPKQETKDPVIGAMIDALLAYKRTGDSSADKDQLKMLLEKATAPFFDGLLAVAAELHESLVSLRRSAPRMTIKLVECEDSELSNSTRLQLAELRALGFAPPRHYSVGTSMVILSVLVFQGTGIVAHLTQSPKMNYASLMVRLIDGNVIEARDSAELELVINPPGWNRIDLPGASFKEMLAALKQASPTTAPVPLTEKDVPRLIEREFKQGMLLRAEEGGYSLKELRAHWGSEISEDELEMRRLENADQTLYNWLRAQEGLSFDPAQVIDRLVIVHDEIDPSTLQAYWTRATSIAKVRKNDFEGRPARAAFAWLNQSKGCPLHLAVSKSTGFPADFYLQP